MDFWKFILDNIVSILALIISAVSIWMNKQQHKENLNLNEKLGEIQKIQNEQQIYFQEQQNRISQIPHFCLELSNPMYVNGMKNLVLPITLINVGIQTATNVHLKPINDKEGLDCFVEIQYNLDPPHFVYEYFDRQFALPQDSISISFTCENHKKYLAFSFRIEFSDLVGRIYEQTFHVIYSGREKFYAQNHSSSIPQCLDRRDGTCNIA